MDTQEVNTRLAELEQEIRQAKELAEAYRRVQQDLVNKRTPRPMTTPAAMPPNGSKPQEQPDSKVGVVREVIKKLERPWNFKEVFEIIRDAGGGLTEKDVQKAVHRLRRGKKISVFERGSGQFPTRYKPGVAGPRQRIGESDKAE